MLRFSFTGNLIRFGACVAFLPAGFPSSLRHWHLHEDEFICMMSGAVTLFAGTQTTLLRPGDAACFKGRGRGGAFPALRRRGRGALSGGRHQIGRGHRHLPRPQPHRDP